MEQFKCLAKQVSFSGALARLPDPNGRLGVLTSGGDSQGMNAALRAVVRTAMAHGMKTYLIKEGYKGLVEGGEKYIVEAEWFAVSNILQDGGTSIGTARCKEFMERPGRLRGAENLIKAGISNLVVVGGDGSLTGANLFKGEWRGYVAELLEAKRVTEEEVAKCPYINIVGLVGSIDNDMCGTDMTIGADTALHRILEAIDCLTNTASSHQRSFVLEVMGRHCGYLALMAGIAGAADWVFIPEQPPPEGWEDVMCQRVDQGRKAGRRHSLIVISEGAVDLANHPITSQDVKSILEKRLGHDTRITVLGHIQRGGKPSAYDRAVATRMGAAAAIYLLKAEGEAEPVLIAVQGNRIMEMPLMECVVKSRAVNKAMEECKFDEALRLRGGRFERNWKLMSELKSFHASPQNTDGPKYRLALMNVGAPAAGTNSAIRAFVRLMQYRGHTVLGIHEGFEGLLKSDVEEMTREMVDGWCSQGGSNLGTNRQKPTKKTLPEIAAKFGEYKIHGLVIIGGFEAYESLIELEKARDFHTAFRIPMIGIPATISNNVPGTEYSLGCDTAINVIVSACDTLKLSANASRKRVFVVETMGGYCGYLATMSALAGGADSAYIFEEKFTIADLQRDVGFLIRKFNDGLQRGVIIRNESCSENFTSSFMCRVLNEEGKGIFIVRDNILGHLQQGDRPSPFDRILGIKFASHAASVLLEQVTRAMTSKGKVRATTHESVCMVGLRGMGYDPVPISELIPKTDFAHRIPHDQWWMSLRPLISLLAQHTDRLFLGEDLPC